MIFSHAALVSQHVVCSACVAAAVLAPVALPPSGLAVAAPQMMERPSGAETPGSGASALQGSAKVLDLR
eukprot:CAMPEP_0181474880 /NCGR_PEP_ID=MMETSP1110-20121109/40890_1 /TAXON_ID=174948 /ORGANISM="Symbiodinium sp., Strain CCMP421" /LENGTH=68 /DNA_ID=CAMNT_0023600087 /DNA_START=482 /DNA_END=685 /DNA_ORIENTATION=-